MKSILVLLFALSGAIAAHADETIVYKGGCMVYTGNDKELARMDLELSRSSQVLLKLHGYSYEVEQVDMSYPQEGRVEHDLILRVMKNGKIVTWADAQVGPEASSKSLLMTKGLPTISCAGGI